MSWSLTTEQDEPDYQDTYSNNEFSTVTLFSISTGLIISSIVLPLVSPPWYEETDSRIIFFPCHPLTLSLVP